MSTPAHDIGLYLATPEFAIGTFAGAAAWSINVGQEPASPPEAVTVYDTGGGAPIPDIELREPTIQVRVRGPNYLAAQAKAEAIFAQLTQPTTREIEGSRYIGIWATSDILALGRDDNDRYLFTANFRCERQPAEEGEGT